MSATVSPTPAANANEACVVCGKSTAGGAGFIAIYVERRRLPLCCPLCHKAFEEDPSRYGGNTSVPDPERALGWDEKW
jgi:hypothetical protein